MTAQTSSQHVVGDLIAYHFLFPNDIKTMLEKDEMESGQFSLEMKKKFGCFAK